MERIIKSFTYLAVATQEATNAINEFVSAYNSVKSRYSPLLWRILSILEEKNNKCQS